MCSSDLELLREGATRIATELADRPALRAELALVIGRSQLARAALADAALTLDQALALFQSGALSDPAIHASLLSERAMVAYEQGHYATSVELLERARELLPPGNTDPAQPDLVRARLADMLVINQRLPEAIDVAGGLVAEQRAQGRTDADSHGYALRVLGAAHNMAGRTDAAIDWLEQAVRSERDQVSLAGTENDLGIAYHDAGRLDDAVRMFTKALELQRRIYGEEHPITLATAGNLATAHLAQGEAELAVAEFERLDRLYRARFGDRPHPDQAHNLGWQAIARYRAGDAAAAARTLGAARAMAAALPPSDAVNLEWLEPLDGLLRFELGQHDDGGLPDAGSAACDGLERMRSLGRWTCIASAWRAAAAEGACRVPSAEPPREPAALAPMERRWWAAWWALRARCGDAGTAMQASREIAALQAQGPAFPDWLVDALPAQEPGADPSTAR